MECPSSLRRLGPGRRVSMSQRVTARPREAYLYVFHDRRISHISGRLHAGSWECIWQDLNDDIAPRIGDGQRGDGDCGATTLAMRFLGISSHQNILTPCLIPQQERGALIGSAAHVAHLLLWSLVLGLHKAATPRGREIAPGFRQVVVRCGRSWACMGRII